MNSRIPVPQSYKSVPPEKLEDMSTSGARNRFLGLEGGGGDKISFASAWWNGHLGNVSLGDTLIIEYISSYHSSPFFAPHFVAIVTHCYNV